MTLGAALGIGEVFGNSLVSARALAGIELPFAVRVSYLGDSPVELVPSVQAGYGQAFSEDERSGFTLRGTVGLRLLPTASAFFFTFEPVSLVLLPTPDPSRDEGSSQLGVEFGLLKIGWRF